MNESIFWRRWVKPTFNYKLLSFEDIESEETKSESTDSKKMNDIYYDFKDGVLTIPIFDDNGYNAREINIKPDSLECEVELRDGRKASFSEANTLIGTTKPARELKLDLRERYSIEDFLLKKVMDEDIRISLSGYSPAFIQYDLTEEDLYLKQEWYKDKEAAMQALPNDIVLKKAPVQWVSRAYDKQGIYSVVKVFPLDDGKYIGIHLTKNKNSSAHE